MPIAPFPHHYAVALAGGELTAGERQPILSGPPPQFGGSSAVWSPEELLVGAALLCLKTTFDAYARREQLTMHDWRGRATGVLDKGRDGAVFTVIELEVELVTEAREEERARTILATAERNCIISRALAAPVKVIARITAAERAAS